MRHRGGDGHHPWQALEKCLAPPEGVGKQASKCSRSDRSALTGTAGPARRTRRQGLTPTAGAPFHILHSTSGYAPGSRKRRGCCCFPVIVMLFPAGQNRLEFLLFPAGRNMLLGDPLLRCARPTVATPRAPWRPRKRRPSLRAGRRGVSRGATMRRRGHDLCGV